MRGTILYISFDGVLQPLGFSQVVRVVARLAERGLPYHLLSVERRRDVADVERVAHTRAVLSAVGVEWTIVSTDLSGSPRRSLEAFARVTAEAGKLAIMRRIRLVHARGYQATIVAQSLFHTARIPYLFDARGCWVDEREDWFSGRAAYAAGKFIEKGLYQNAAAVVTLTQLHANDVTNGIFGHRDPRFVKVIPTCADYAEFRIGSGRPSKPTGISVIPPQVRDRLEGKSVLAIVGSINRSYDLDATIVVARRAMSARPKGFHLLVVTQQTREYAELMTAAGMPANDYTITSVSHGTMADWLHWVDWGFLILPDVAAKRGSMPTKLAEFFAAGVQPIAYGCNAEMLQWIRRAATGFVLESLDAEVLTAAGSRVAASNASRVDLEAARALTAPHFSLDSGVARYSTLLRALDLV